MGSFNGLYRASVVNTVDPLGQGRIQVSVAAVAGGGTQWALPCRPLHGRSQTHSPQVGTTAWVMFEQGDPTMPVWIGFML